MAARLRTDYGLALVRMAVGLYFLATAYEKTKTGWLTDGRPLARMLRNSLPRALPLDATFLRDWVIPHAALCARLTTIAEWTVGISLLLGLFTQAGALVGIWLNLNYMAMKGLASSAGSVDRLFVLCEIVFLVSAAGLVLGLDGVVWNRLIAPLTHRRSAAAVASSVRD